MMNLNVIENQARFLAKENRQAEPEIIKVYWFPDDKEVRLVEVHPHVAKSADGSVHPFFFRPSPADNLPASTGVAMINPIDYGTATLPPEWGTWGDAVELTDDS
jgi:hypothetical protein